MILESGCISDAILEREHLEKRHKDELMRLKQKEDGLKKALFDLVPVDLVGWVSSQRLINRLFEDQIVLLSIRFNKGYFLGFMDVREKIFSLMMVWQGFVRVQIKDPETDQVDILFMVS